MPASTEPEYVYANEVLAKDSSQVTPDTANSYEVIEPKAPPLPPKQTKSPLSLPNQQATDFLVEGLSPAVCNLNIF